MLDPALSVCNIFILYSILHNCIAWRREMGGAIHNILHHQLTLVTVSGDSHMLLRAWYTETGLLRWEVPLSSRTTPTKQWPLSSHWTPDGISAVVCGTKKGKRFIFLKWHYLRILKILLSNFFCFFGGGGFCMEISCIWYN